MPASPAAHHRPSAMSSGAWVMETIVVETVVMKVMKTVVVEAMRVAEPVEDED